MYLVLKKFFSLSPFLPLSVAHDNVLRKLLFDKINLWENLETQRLRSIDLPKITFSVVTHSTSNGNTAFEPLLLCELFYDSGVRRRLNLHCQYVSFCNYDFSIIHNSLNWVYLNSSCVMWHPTPVLTNSMASEWSWDFTCYLRLLLSLHFGQNNYYSKIDKLTTMKPGPF